MRNLFLENGTVVTDEKEITRIVNEFKTLRPKEEVFSILRSVPITSEMISIEEQPKLGDIKDVSPEYLAAMQGKEVPHPIYKPEDIPIWFDRSNRSTFRPMHTSLWFTVAVPGYEPITVRTYFPVIVGGKETYGKVRRQLLSEGLDNETRSNLEARLAELLEELKQEIIVHLQKIISEPIN